MKKAFSLMLVFVLCFGLCACGRGEVKRNASTAPYLDFNAYISDYRQNAAKAETEYEGKIFRYKGTVYEIGTESCLVSHYSGATTIALEVCLAKEDLIKLTLGETYTFAGKFKHSFFTPYLTDAVIVE